MASLLNDSTAPRLERSCGPAADDWIRIAPSSCGFERIEAFFLGHAFDPHRHDTYAIGFTIHTRYAAARHFRACLGTSPYRYLILRRLDQMRSLMRHGAFAEAALASGFADQSHMTRHFKKACGMPPGRWAAIVV